MPNLACGILGSGNGAGGGSAFDLDWKLLTAAELTLSEDVNGLEVTTPAQNGDAIDFDVATALNVVQHVNSLLYSAPLPDEILMDGTSVQLMLVDIELSAQPGGKWGVLLGLRDKTGGGQGSITTGLQMNTATSNLGIVVGPNTTSVSGATLAAELKVPGVILIGGLFDGVGSSQLTGMSGLGGTDRFFGAHAASNGGNAITRSEVSLVANIIHSGTVSDADLITATIRYAVLTLLTW